MLNVIVKFLCAIGLPVSGFFIIKKILKSDQKLFSVKTLVPILVMAVLTFLLHQQNYVFASPIIFLMFLIVIYRQVFDITLVKSCVASGIMLAIYIFADTVASLIMVNITTMDNIRTVWYYMLIGNALVIILALLITLIKPLMERLYQWISKIDQEKYDEAILFIMLTILALSTLVGNYVAEFKLGVPYFLNIGLILIFIIILGIYVKEKSFNKKLNSEYQMLWNHVEVYENAIENDKMTRHELKNTLGSIRNMTKSKNIIEKIDGILDDVNIIENCWIEELKNLPKGTIKALLYYKMSVAKENGIRILVDVSPKVKKSIGSLNDSKDICNLLGIYVDNAIEAASSSKKKEVAIEIYQLKDLLYFTVSNTFGDILDLDQIGKKGVSTKGKGRGNGLTYAAKIIKNNDFISETHNVKNKYYIVQLMVNLNKEKE